MPFAKYIISLFIALLLVGNLFAQPTTCFEIEKILVDACGSPEGENEMVRFTIGPNPLNVNDLTVDWPNNSWRGIVQNIQTDSIVDSLNATIQNGCGLILQPTNDTLPAGETVLMACSFNFIWEGHDFSNFNDTIYMIFQDTGNTSGHFKNWCSAPCGTRTLIMTFSPPVGCSDTVVFYPDSLTNQSGGYGGSSSQRDGGAVEYDYTGTATYVNDSCTAPVQKLPNDINLTGGSMSTTFCAGDSVQLTASAGQTYLWYPGGETTQMIWVYSAGQYEVRISFGGGSCYSYSDTVNVTVNSLPTLSITPNPSAAFCSGDSVLLYTGIFSSYLWLGGQTTDSIYVSSGGSYTVQVTDSNGCTNTSSATTVTANSLPTATITANDTTTFCNGDSVILSANAASSYLWSPGGETSQSITVLSSGSYSVSITDSNGCSDTSSVTSVTVNPDPPPSISTSGTTVFCIGDSVILLAIAANSYLWSPTNDTTQSITVTTSGTYNVQVTDSNGCTATAPDTIVTVNTLPTPTVSSTGNTICQGDSVTLTSSVATNYLWIPSGDTTQSITIDTTGNFNVFVTDSNGCSDTSTVITITVNSLPTATVTVNGTTSFCQNDSVVLTANTASSYAWSPGSEITQSITVVSSGNYSVSITDSNGCSDTSGVTLITVNPLPTPIITAGGPTTLCPGDSVTLTSSLAANYLWIPLGDTTQAVSADSTGNYSVLVTDSNGCSNTSAVISVTVSAAPTSNITASGPTAFCMGDSVILTADLGVSYLWLPNGDTTQSITVTASGNYSVQINYGSNCIGFSDTATVTVYLLPNADAGADVSICESDSATLTASGGTNYLWNTGDTTISISVSDTSTTTYFITVSDVNCSANDSVTVTIYPLPSVSISGNTILCMGESTTLTTSGGGIFSYVWNTSETTASISANPITSTVYSVTVTSIDGCLKSDSVTVIVNPLPTAIAGTDTTIDEGSSIQLTSSGGVSFSWSPSTGLDCDNCADPIASPTQSTTYVVYLANANGCKDSTFVTITVNAIGDYYFVPNIFSPNDDGLNDILYIGEKGLTEVYFVIYERWGEKVFETTDIAQGWDGKFNGREMNSAVFVYVLTGIFEGKEIEEKGNITLIRY